MTASVLLCGTTTSAQDVKPQSGPSHVEPSEQEIAPAATTPASTAATENTAKEESPPTPSPTSAATSTSENPAEAGATAPLAEPAEVKTEPEPSSMFDWWPKYITPVPIVFYTPENQFGFGAGMMATWQMPGAWKDRPSNVTVYGVYTTRAQTIVGASHELHFDDDRHVVTQEFRYIDWPDRFYGFGNATRDSDRENFTDHYLQLESEYQARVYKRLYVGARHLWRASETQNIEPDGRLASERPRGVGDVTWSGAGPVLVWDTRQGLFWPVGGSLLRADATFYGRALGSDFNATLLRLDLRHYQPIWFGHVLALRFVSFGVTGAPPFQLVPSLGGSLLFRGWFLGRLRERVLAATEAEYRVALTRRWSVAGFGSVGRVAPSLDALSVKGLHVTGGAGVRFAVRAESRANFRLDVAYGDDVSIYFQFREAF